MKNLYFFYGSLRSGYWNNGILTEDSILLSPAVTVDNFNLYVGKSGHVPTCVPTDGGHPLVGELWVLSEKDARNVHRLETGYESRTFLVRRDDNGEVVPATIYFNTKAESCGYLWGGPVLVASGDYATVITRDGGRIRPARDGSVQQG